MAIKSAVDDADLSPSPCTDPCSEMWVDDTVKNKVFYLHLQGFFNSHKHQAPLWVLSNTPPCVMLHPSMCNVTPIHYYIPIQVLSNPYAVSVNINVKLHLS